MGWVVVVVVRLTACEERSRREEAVAGQKRRAECKERCKVQGAGRAEQGTWAPGQQGRSGRGRRGRERTHAQRTQEREGSGNETRAPLACYWASVISAVVPST